MLLVNGRSSRALIGDLAQKEDRVFTMILDSQDDKKTVADITNTLRRLRSLMSKNFCCPTTVLDRHGRPK